MERSRNLLGLLTAVALGGVGVALVAISLDANSAEGPPTHSAAAEARRMETPEPAMSREPTMLSQWQTLTYPDAGFEVQVPASWQIDDVEAFGIDAVAPGRLIIFRASDPGGVLQLLSQGGSRQAQPSSLDELEGVIADEFRDVWELESDFQIADRSIDLGGVAARWVQFETAEESMGPSVLRNVIAIHNGRPFTISWSGAQIELIPIAEILATFRFMDSAPSETGTSAFTYTGQGFAVTVPEGWHVWPIAYGSGIELTGPGAGVTVRTAGEDGRYFAIYRSGVGKTVAVDSLDELVDLVVGEYQHVESLRPEQMSIVTAPAELDGEAAVRIELSSRSGVQLQMDEYVVALNNGLPYVVRWTGASENASRFESILESFRFLD